MYTLPAALAPLGAWRQFVLVRLDRTDTPGKLGKFPSWPHDQPTTHTRGDGTTVQVGKWGMIDAHRPDVWMDWRTAAALAAIGPISGNTVGWCIGFVITKNDPFVCIDQDSCAQPDGSWLPKTQEIIGRLATAQELSLSGVGLHGWGWYTGQCPPHGKRNKHLNIEMYSELRFIALGGEASGEMRDLTSILPQFINDYFPYVDDEEGEVVGWTDAPVPEYTPLTDDEVIARGMASTRKQDPSAVFGGGPILPNFSDLWTRNVAVLARAFPPQMPGKEFDGSDADCALAKELAYWTGKDCERIARLMRQSALVRDKWDTRRGPTTYLNQTVQQGVSFCNAVYHVKPIMPAAPTLVGGKLAPRAIDHNTFVGRENYAVLFDMCVYIQDQNSVLLPNGDIVDQPRFNAKFAGYAFVMDQEGTKTSKSAWEAFLGNQIIHFPRVEGTEFNPRLDFQYVVERGGRQWVNVYKRPFVDRRPGDVQPFMDLLRKLFPRGDDATILLSYMAAVVQSPGVKFRWAPFIQGTRGNGKSTLVECLKYALGEKYVFTLKAGMIENGFNSWLENNILYVADDIYSTRDRTDMMEALKSLITGRDQAITLKGIDSIQKRIVGNFIFMDNHRDAMKKQEDTRDLCVLYCAQQSRSDRVRDGLTREYFANTFYPWLERGGYAFVAELLATMPIDPRYNPAGECQEAPETSATREAVKDGRTGIEHEVMEWVELEEPGFCGDFISYNMLKNRMTESPRYAKSATPLKIKEFLGRLGYEEHRGLPNGRTSEFVRPDNTRPILYVKRDTVASNMIDPAAIAALYQGAQDAATAAQTARRWNP